VRAGTPERVRPCVLCNQTCRVRDNRNPVVTCITDPRSGFETRDTDPEPAPSGRTGRRREVLVIGAGPAGLEAARVLAGRGHTVRVAERADRAGGAARWAARLPGRARFDRLLDWWQAECERLGVAFAFGLDQSVTAVETARREGASILLATGGRPGPQAYSVAEGAVVRTDAQLLAAGVADLPPGPVLVLDLVGGPIAVGLAEALAGAGRQVTVVTADQIVGTLLAMSGDLADGNTRLLQAGVIRRTSTLLREVGPGSAVLEDRFSGRRQDVDCAVLVHCGHRLPAEELYLARPGTPRAGDCVAPRSVLEAVLEGRRAALMMDASAAPPSVARMVDAGDQVPASATVPLAGAR